MRRVGPSRRSSARTAAKRRRQRRWSAGILGGIAVAACLVAVPFVSRGGRWTDALHGNAAAKVKERVLVLGASVAEGWDDKVGGGYLIRAFKTLSAETGASYTVYNKASAGNGCLQVVKQYPVWLQVYHPQVVVISWGALDDLHDGTPLATVEAQVRWETQLALAHHAVVILATPPITRASYVGKYAITEPEYVNHEIAGLESLKSQNTYVANVFAQMKSYLVTHHQTYEPYMGDGWHPNTAGHVLAGQLLSTDIERSFGQNPIVFKLT